MWGNIIKKRLTSYAFEKTPCNSLSCKLQLWPTEKSPVRFIKDDFQFVLRSLGIPMFVSLRFFSQQFQSLVFKAVKLFHLVMSDRMKHKASHT